MLLAPRSSNEGTMTGKQARLPQYETLSREKSRGFGIPEERWQRRLESGEARGRRAFWVIPIFYVLNL